MAAGQIDLARFNEFVRTAFTLKVTQQVEKFNEASNSTILLRANPIDGDYFDESLYDAISGIVRRRDAYDNTPTAVAAVTLTQSIESAVKVAAGTPPIDVPPGQWAWIQRNPDEYARVIGEQMAVGALQDKLNSAIAALVAAFSNAAVLALVEHDVSAGAKITPRGLNAAVAKFTDRSQSIAAFVIHGTPMHDYWDAALANAERLFEHESVTVIADPWGRPFIVTDAPALVSAGPVYKTLGLVQGAAEVQDQSDMQVVIDESAGFENIQRKWQAQWSFTLGVKHFTWDKTNGGSSPDDAAIATATNWDVTSADLKNYPGVVLKHD